MNQPPTAPLNYFAPPAAIAPHEIQSQLTAAHIAAKPLRRAASYGSFDAWSIALFAAITFVGGLFSAGISAIALGLAMTAIAWVEFTGVTRLRRLDPTALPRLARNQLAFSAALIFYALWSIYADLHAPADPSTADLNDAFKQLGLQSDSFQNTITYLVYGLLIAVAICMQGGTALYYYTRQKHLDHFLKTTPSWILDLHRSGTPL